MTNERYEMSDNEMINELLLRVDSPETGALLRALGVYVLDPQHAFDVKAREQGRRALRMLARYAGVEGIA